MTDTVLAVCEVYDRENEPGWGVRHDPCGILIGVSSEALEAQKREMAKRDTANFSYEYNPIKVFRTSNMEIAREVIENQVLHVVNEDRVKWIMSELKPF
jgi:hypothetical protein